MLWNPSIDYWRLKLLVCPPKGIGCNYSPAFRSMANQLTHHYVGAWIDNYIHILWMILFISASIIVNFALKKSKQKPRKLVQQFIILCADHLAIPLRVDGLAPNGERQNAVYEITYVFIVSLTVSNIWYQFWALSERISTVSDSKFC